MDAPKVLSILNLTSPLRVWLVVLSILLIIASLVTYSMLNSIPTNMSDNPFISPNKTLVIAHQGGERLYPSNTLYAFDEAYKLGVDMFELDIHESKDGHLVVIHDDSVDRTTDGQGYIKEMDLAEIQALDAGYYWTEDGNSYPYRGQGIKIPSLAELFERYPTMPMVIDIKQKEPEIEQQLCNLLRQYNKTEHTIIGSFHPTALQKFRSLCPETPTSMQPNEIRRMVIYSYLSLKGLFRPQARAAQVPTRSGAINIVHPGFIKLAKQRNIAVHAWTINDVQEMKDLIALGVDGIMTDRPDLLLEILGR